MERAKRVIQTPPIEILIEGLVRGSNAQLTVGWDKMKGRRVHSQSHIHKGEYICEYEVYKCIILDTTLKDPRLHALVTSIRGALRREGSPMGK